MRFHIICDGTIICLLLYSGRFICHDMVTTTPRIVRNPLTNDHRQDMALHNDKILPLFECISNAEDAGHKERFVINSRGMIPEMRKCVYSPAETRITSSYSFENDARSRSSFYLVETSDGKRGYLVGPRGISSDERVSEFVKNIEQSSTRKIKSVGGKESWLESARHFLQI